MRYVVIGAGAIGGGVGGLLHRSGSDTTLVARGEHLAVLRERGLRLRQGHDEHLLDVRAVGHPREAAWSDDTVVLLAVKSHQTASALADLVPVLPPSTPVFSLQNGVSNERELLRHVPHVHGVCVMMPATHLRPGEVVCHATGHPGLLDVGRFPGGSDDVDHAVAADLRAAGFDSVVREDVMAWKHRKLLVNLGNAVLAACGPGPDADELVRRAREEGRRVLATAGVQAVGEEEDLARRGDLMGEVVDREPGSSSSWQSLARGTGEIEADHLNGEIVLLGRLHGVPAPVNELVQRAAGALARGRGEPGSLDARGLLARLAGQSTRS